MSHVSRKINGVLGDFRNLILTSCGACVPGGNTQYSESVLLEYLAQIVISLSQFYTP